ncbi:MAG: phospholipase D-like domain-containing protein DpdK [Planctomycetaceae bacterium]
MNGQTSDNRNTFTTQTTSRAEIRELLEGIFVAELLVPSDTVWLVSPWITDIDILDNRCGQFSSLVPTWGLRRIRLSEVFAQIMDESVVHIVARPDPHNDTFLQKMRDLSIVSGAVENLRVTIRDTLHLKGLLGEDYYLSGSMNLTYNGVEVNHEGVSLDRSPESIAEARIHFQENYEADQ